MSRSSRSLPFLALIVALSAGLPLAAHAVHDTGRNLLTFAPVPGSPSPNSSGCGEITLTSGTLAAGDDRWSTFTRITGLQPNSRYTVAAKGEFADAEAFTPICSFTTDRDGSCSSYDSGWSSGSSWGGSSWGGGDSFDRNRSSSARCYNSFIGLRRNAVVQIRLGDANGIPVLQATRAAGGLGTIITVPFNDSRSACPR